MGEPTRFVTDASLEQVARRLRFLGYDVLTHRGARLEELFAAAASDGRTVLTLSSRRPSSRSVPEHLPGAAPAAVLQLPRADLEGAIRVVTASHAPATAPWSRCPTCNVALHRRSTFEARGEVPGRVARLGVPLTWCPQCGRWFWPGTHVERLNAWFERVLGHSPGPPEAGGGA